MMMTLERAHLKKARKRERNKDLKHLIDLKAELSLKAKMPRKELKEELLVIMRVKIEEEVDQRVKERKVNKMQRVIEAKVLRKLLLMKMQLVRKVKKEESLKRVMLKDKTKAKVAKMMLKAIKEVIKGVSQEGKKRMLKEVKMTKEVNLKARKKKLREAKVKKQKKILKVEANQKAKV